MPRAGDGPDPRAALASSAGGENTRWTGALVAAAAVLALIGWWAYLNVPHAPETVALVLFVLLAGTVALALTAGRYAPGLGSEPQRFGLYRLEGKIEEGGVATVRFSHFGPEANLFAELEQLFRDYSEGGGGRARKYLHNDEEAAPFGQQPGTFTPWEHLPAGTDCLFYEGLHGAVATGEVDAARHVDLLIGVVPVINLEWIQKLHRDRATRGYSTEAVTDTILRRMYDYVHYIVPQFSRTHVNFQRVPVVDTSNPFIARHIPTQDESMLVIRFRDPRGIDFPYLLSMLAGSFMSRANTIVCPGGRMDLAMQLIFTPMIWRLMERRKQALGQ